MSKLNYSYATVSERTGLSESFIRRYNDINFNGLMNLYKKRIKDLGTDRQVKNVVYSMKISVERKDTIWNAYVKTYMSHCCINYIPIRQSSNYYVNYKEMIY